MSEEIWDAKNTMGIDGIGQDVGYLKEAWVEGSLA